MANFKRDKQGVIPIEVDGEKIAEIRVGDLLLHDKIVELFDEVSALGEKLSALQAEVDESGKIESSEIVKQSFDKVYTKIDNLLGEGVSKKVFNGVYDIILLIAFCEFLVAEVGPATKKEREKRMNKYIKGTNAL